MQIIKIKMNVHPLITLLILITISISTLTGCSSVNTDVERAAYNVSIRDVAITGFKDESTRYSQSFIVECSVNNESNRYNVVDIQLYSSIQRLKQLYAVSNPGEPLKLDLIYDTHLKAIVAVALSPKTKTGTK